MIMTKNLKRILSLNFILILFSCETLQDISGLSKPNLENDLAEETPELVLPPDFDMVAKPSRNQSIQRNQVARSEIIPYQSQSVQPRIQNFSAPQINVESSPTPSDSLERFKENKKFTIGQWVYGQYVQGFKQGNLYYRPIYDKGYNFSRRYLPDQNVSSFLNYPPASFGDYNNLQNTQLGSDPRNLENLPIID
tara:strand:+ start:233 stop:814 length:582 start_codon:yes stop_codon:yes gene_type:complete